MTNISHKIGVSADKATVISALNSVEGLSRWWTRDTRGDASEGGTLCFRFGDSGLDMKVTETTSDSVSWQCVSGPEEWIGTEINFLLREEGETALYFQHRNWESETPFHHHCSTKWAVFLLSLKQYLDEGAGKPFPDDQKITTLMN